MVIFMAHRDFISSINQFRFLRLWWARCPPSPRFLQRSKTVGQPVLVHAAAVEAAQSRGQEINDIADFQSNGSTGRNQWHDDAQWNESADEAHGIPPGGQMRRGTKQDTLRPFTYRQGSYPKRGDYTSREEQGYHANHNVDGSGRKCR